MSHDSGPLTHCPYCGKRLPVPAGASATAYPHLEEAVRYYQSKGCQVESRGDHWVLMKAPVRLPFGSLSLPPLGERVYLWVNQQGKVIVEAPNYLLPPSADQASPQQAGGASGPIMKEPPALSPLFIVLMVVFVLLILAFTFGGPLQEWMDQLAAAGYLGVN